MTRIEAARSEVQTMITELHAIESEMERLVLRARERSFRYRQLQAQKSGIRRQAQRLRVQWKGRLA